MSKQAEYTKQSALQQILEGINEFVPMLCIEHKKTGCVITQNYTIKNNGGDRFGIFLEKVLLEEKDYLINKVIIMSKNELKDVEDAARDEAQAFLDGIT